jgi:hypothetical protein
MGATQHIEYRPLDGFATYTLQFVATKFGPCGYGYKTKKVPTRPAKEWLVATKRGSRSIPLTKRRIFAAVKDSKWGLIRAKNLDTGQEGNEPDCGMLKYVEADGVREGLDVD